MFSFLINIVIFYNTFPKNLYTNKYTYNIKMVYPVKINKNTSRILNIIKTRYGLKNKSEAANFMLEHYGEGLFKLKL